MTANPGDELLAIDGGTAACPGPAALWPLPDQEIREALDQLWADGTWGHYDGPATAKLCEYLAHYTNAPHIMLCSSGTIGVELALRGLGIGLGDEVILAGYDFPGNFRAIEAVGASPVLVDLVPNSWTLDLDQIALAVGSQTRAIIISHMHGLLIDMPRLCALAKEFQLKIVEDACQVPGAIIAGRHAGVWGDVGVWSFGGSKLLTAGRGGAVLTSSPEIYQRLKIFCQRGNLAFPLSQLQAAVLPPQLARLRERNARRREAVSHLVTQTRNLPGLRSGLSGNAVSREIEIGSQHQETAFYKLPWLVDTSDLGDVPIARLAAALVAEGIGIGQGFKGFANRSSRRCRKINQLPHSRRAAETTLLLHHPVLLASQEQLDAVVQGMAKVFYAFHHGSSH